MRIDASLEGENMRSLSTLEGISDGKIYDIEDQVKVDTGGCNGCSACCHAVGDLVGLTPFDVYQIKSHLNKSFDELLVDHLQLRGENKLALPYLKMHGETERCSFLNQEERCSIHAYRPNICRLFPLGRIYERGSFKYFLQVNSCLKPHLKEVRIKEWIDIKDYDENKTFILAWHDFLKALSFRMRFIRDEKEQEVIRQYILDTFYRTTLNSEDHFYAVFWERLPEAKKHLGIL